MINLRKFTIDSLKYAIGFRSLGLGFLRYTFRIADERAGRDQSGMDAGCCYI